MMVAANTSETSVNFYQTTWCNIPEDSHLDISITVITILTATDVIIISFSLQKQVAVIPIFKNKQ
jgi:hypothetical protein